MCLFSQSFRVGHLPELGLVADGGAACRVRLVLSLSQYLPHRTIRVKCVTLSAQRTYPLRGTSLFRLGANTVPVDIRAWNLWETFVGWLVASGSASRARAGGVFPIVAEDDRLLKAVAFLKEPRSLHGALRGTGDEDDYRRHLEEKYL